MIIRLTLILLLSLAGSVQGAQVVLEGGTSRYVASSNDTISISGTKVSYTGQALYIGGCTNVVILGNGDTLVFNTADSNSVSNDTSHPNGEYAFPGIFINGSSNVLCSSLVLLQGGTTGGHGNAGILGAGSKHITFKTGEIHMKGRSSRGIDIWTGCWDWIIRGNDLTSYVDEYYDRQYNQASPVAFPAEGTALDSLGQPGYWTVQIVGNTIDSMPHSGLIVYGKARVDSNTIIGDAHNDMYDRPSGDAAHSADNPYGIGGGNLLPGSSVYGNYLGYLPLDSGGDEGMQGIIFEAAQGDSANPTRISRNTIRTAHSQSDYEGATDASFGIRLRNSSGECKPLRYVHVDSNDIYLTADQDAATIAGTMAFGIYFTDNGACDTYHADSIGIGNRMLNNKITAMVDGTWSDGEGTVACIALEVGDGSVRDLEPGRDYSRGNLCSTNVVGIKFASGNGGGNDWHSDRDTIVMVPPFYKSASGNANAPFYLGGGGECLDNYIFDPWFPNDTLADSAAFQNYNDGYEIFNNATMNITIRDTAANPISGAIVWVADQYNDTTWDTTGADGIAAKSVRYNFRSFDTDNTPDRIDSTYGPQTIGAAKTGDTVTATTLIWWNNKDTVLTLTATGGEEPAATTKKKKGGYHKGGRW